MHTDEWGAEDFRITGDPGRRQAEARHEGGLNHRLDGLETRRLHGID
jgi:hypothetical protein